MLPDGAGSVGIEGSSRAAGGNTGLIGVSTVWLPLGGGAPDPEPPEPEPPEPEPPEPEPPVPAPSPPRRCPWCPWCLWWCEAPPCPPVLRCAADTVTGV